MSDEYFQPREGLIEPRKVFRGVVARESDGKKFPMEVIEYEPQIRVCKFLLYGKHSQHYLAFPFMQFTRLWADSMTTLHVTFSNEPMKDGQDGLTQELAFPPLPNVWYPSCQCCLMSSPSDTFQDMMAYFWNTRYLDCETWYCFPVLDKETPMRTYPKWEKMTREDPNFILDVDWQHKVSIVEMLEECNGGKPKRSPNSGWCSHPNHGRRGFAAVRGARRTDTPPSE